MLVNEPRQIALSVIKAKKALELIAKQGHTAR